MLLSTVQVWAQTSSGIRTISKAETIDVDLVWNEVNDHDLRETQAGKPMLSFSNARYRGADQEPFFAKTFQLQQGVEQVSVVLSSVQTELINGVKAAQIPYADNGEIVPSTSYFRSNGHKYVVISLPVVLLQENELRKVVSFSLTVTEVVQSGRDSRSSNAWKENSVLNSGRWLKLTTYEDAIYKVSYKMLKNAGVEVSSLLSSQLKLFGTTTGVISTNNSVKRPDDLTQISIHIEDGGDGTFDPGDHFLFYGEDQVVWKEANGYFEHEPNPYADSVHYFLTVDPVEANIARVVDQSSVGTANVSVNTVNYYDVHESDETNLIKSGRQWYGEKMGIVKFHDLGFSVPDVDQSSQARVKAKFAGRSVNNSSVSMTVSLPNQGGVNTSYTFQQMYDFYGARYADDETKAITVTPSGANFLTKLELNNSSNPSAEAWIDYVEVSARRSLTQRGNSMVFQDLESVAVGNVAEFQLKSDFTPIVWDITNKFGVEKVSIKGNVQDGFRFSAPTDSLKVFVSFNPDVVQEPIISGEIQNQNVHGLANIDYVVISHPKFFSQAQRLADLHEAVDGFTTVVITPQQIYNEFSGGVQDITAIKEFMRMLYFEGNESGGRPPRYLLLFGDASYDYKNRVSGNSNFVPTHQTKNSLTPTGSIASDDYYALMDDDEGEANLDAVDFGVGRIPARTKTEAEGAVTKIERYIANSQSFGSWRNYVSFVADDADKGDGHTFMRDCDAVSEIIEEESPDFTVKKLYMDAYPQVVGSGGERYPQGAEAIDDRVSNGCLMMYYIGHGGELGWAHERVLEVPTINKWSNLDNSPLFVTATCEFARFDDPRRTSAGEYVLLNPSGAGIGLLTTTRAVYSSPNLTLTTEFTSVAFEKIDGESPRLGDLMMLTKVRTIDTNQSAGSNSRSFALLGDPGLKLAYPELDIIITDMPDTVKALEKVTIKGHVLGAGGQKATWFNGILDSEVFDKKTELQTLNNDGVGPYKYSEWKNLVFNGKSSVKEGEFTIEFVVPKDINKEIALGRISLYAENGERDANGDFQEFSIGGVSDNPISDDEGPQVELYMNNTDFVFGGLTNEEPNLYGLLYDDNGINMVGNGIGHDITAVLDEKTSSTLILNDFYESDVDSYQSGKVIYPFNELEDGRHTLRLKAWDVNNNPEEAYTEFVVANDEELALDHVLNYPNPFTTNTDFYFEHNKPGQSLLVRIEIFTVSGKLVKILDGSFESNGYRVGPINWNGKDEFGDKLGKGVYVYRVSVKTILGEQTEKFERIVLLN